MGPLMGRRTSLKAWLVQMSDRLQWETSHGTRAFQHRFGVPGWIVLAAAAIGAGALLLEWQQTNSIAAAEASGMERRQVPRPVLDTSGNDARKRLAEFEEYLPAHDDIPDVVRKLLDLAAQERLQIKRGEYRPQADPQGRFLRYRMMLPVNGDPQSIHRFIHAALRAQRTLALESVQFKRESGESPVIEARIQWAVLTRLPANGAGGQALASSGGGQ